MANVFESLVLLLLLVLVGSAVAWALARRSTATMGIADPRASAIVLEKIRHGRADQLITESRVAEIFTLSDDLRLSGLGGLNQREFVVAELMAEGFSVTSIATHLKIAADPIARHSYNVFQKLGVRTHKEMVLAWNKLKAEALNTSHG